MKFLAFNFVTMNHSISLLFFCSLLTFTACQEKSGDHNHDGHTKSENSPNKELYDQVMEVHDEVMPKMNDLYKAKAALKSRLSAAPDDKQKEEINAKIAQIDAASEGMMVWMRQFNPLPDSAGEDTAKAYLEAELTKVRKVKEDILRALETAK